MRLFTLLFVASSVHAAPTWQSVGSTNIGLGGGNELEVDDGMFVVGRPSAQNAMGMLTTAAPIGAPVNLTPTGPEPGAEFGFRVAVAGNLMAVTSARRTVTFPQGGPSVSFYERSGEVWSRTHTTSAPYQPSPEWEFGFGLAVTHDRVFIGAPGMLTQRGVVYVYERTGAGAWPQGPNGSVFAYDGDSSDMFGTVIAAEGDWLAIGAPLMERDPGAESQGAVYMFRWIDGVYVQAQRLMTPSPQNFGSFGQAMDLDGGTLIVGAPGEDDPVAGQDAGAAYVFGLAGEQWEFRQRITASDAEPGDSFGHAVSKKGEALVIAAPSDDNEFGVNMGTAYVFERQAGTWQETGRIAPAKPPIAINATAIARLDYVAPDTLVRYYPTTERIFTGSFENPLP